MKITYDNYGDIYNGDCLDVMKEIEDKSVDLTVTSPPYDNLRTYNGYSFDFENTAKELFRITKDGGVVVWVVGDQTINGSETGTSFKQALYFKEIGFNLHDTMIWYKDACRFPDKTRYYDSFEFMFVLSKGRPKSINQIADKKNKWGGTIVHGTKRMDDGSTQRLVGHNKKNIKEYGVRYNLWLQHNVGDRNNSHPAIFPKKLAKDHIISWSNENDLVFDPFLGSGTTVVASVETNRRFIGSEISEEYFTIAKNRIEEKINNSKRGLF
jgi:site-specific DNA-methyltransferase (adenine-specific)